LTAAIADDLYTPPPAAAASCSGVDPSIGGQIGKTQSAIIISNDVSNRELTPVRVVPPATNVVARFYPS
jgi:mRNA-degrading endonuclease toxin of MazEF toxin-antitoxin module